MRRLFIQSTTALLLALMFLVPTDFLRMGLEHLCDHSEIISLTLESELDTEEEKESKEKDSKENKKLLQTGLDIYMSGYIPAWSERSMAHIDDHVLAHFLDTWTPPPEQA